MEITMYEDSSYNSNMVRENLAQMKRKFTLDLNSRSTKKIRTLAPPNFNALLTSPDLNMLKLGSPELDQLVLQQGSLLPNGFNFPTPTPTSSSTKTVVTPIVTQEEFVKGFQDTLEQFHNKDNVSKNSCARNSSSEKISSVEYTQLESSIPINRHEVPVSSSSDESTISIKEEPQTVPSVCGSPPVSPINMETQEKIKLERKRLRNRIAAFKCRQRKLEKISKLEEKVLSLKSENTELQSIINKMRDEVCALKQEVMEHINAGCQIACISQS